MKKQIFATLLFFSISYGGSIGIYKPEIRNLPKEYSSIFLGFLLNNFHNVELFNKKNSYLYIIKPLLSSIGGNYNICFDIYKKDKILKVLCGSAENGEQLFEKLLHLTYRTGILKQKKQFEKKQIYLKVLTYSKNFENKMKVVSRNGDTLLKYTATEKFKGQQVPHITVGNGIINIDTIILTGAEASKVLEYLLNGYRFKGILIITVK